MYVDGPPKYGLGTPQYGDYVPTSWKNCIFSSKCRFLTIFPLGRSNWLQITKNNFLRFLAFYPLISAFQAFWCIANGRSWRDLSIPIKNSWFHAMWLGIRPFLCSMYESHGLGIVSLSKIYRKSIENLSKIYRTSIENLWIAFHLPEHFPESLIEHLPSI